MKLINGDSLFTTEDNTVKASAIWEVLKPLPSQIRHRNRVPRKACIYLLSQIVEIPIDDTIIREIAEGQGIGREPSPSFELPSISKYASYTP